MSRLEQVWWGTSPGWPERAWLAPLLPLEGAFRAAAGLRGWLYDHGLLAAASAPAPVISVGNLAVGGAGKTPVAIAVARALRARGRTVAVLSRGYGATRADPRVVADGEGVRLGAAEGGDEPVLIARRLPGVRVLCGPRRADLVPGASALGADALVLDDGFQHRALARDLDVVVLDAANPVGNGHLLPAGPNREPPSALRRAGLVWLSRADQAEPALLARWREVALAATGRAPVESRHAPLDVVDGTLGWPPGASRPAGADHGAGLDALRGARVLLLSGLARPGAFRRTVEGLGAEVVLERRYPDHHRFTAAEVAEALSAASDAGCRHVVTTEKDAVRLDPSTAADPRLAVVRRAAEVLRGAEALEAALDAALALGDARRSQPPPAPGAAT